MLRLFLWGRVILAPCFELLDLRSIVNYLQVLKSFQKLILMYVHTKEDTQSCTSLVHTYEVITLGKEVKNMFNLLMHTKEDTWSCTLLGTYIWSDNTKNFLSLFLCGRVILAQYFELLDLRSIVNYLQVLKYF